MCPFPVCCLGQDMEFLIIAFYLLSWSSQVKYRKIPKTSDTRKFAVITLKVQQGGFTLE